MFTFENKPYHMVLKAGSFGIKENKMLFIITVILSFLKLERNRSVKIFLLFVPRGY
jgi:hypothetical protein